ncbi:pyroglutamyl-peptidase I [Pantoea cypripedii]|uniref:Pyrrolidone-carboxylate peptidase n=1 Tax=Pantoea cypripedii TaxID=55209 RepID=A0A1X1ESB1_PANCY|nr:pyroglutamyl-peptidase I [Pantoea cypripedii]MBP2196895.1 pyroglutamyl-peptidase [Pantoea cypripedii]ORM92847.1 pyroglutamyl-peptidase I [Pantoea cypripedii]
MKTVLMTAFEPFEGESINPSWEAVSSFEGRVINGARVVVRQLPVVFSRCGVVLAEALDELQPDRILCIGQAGGRSDITVERVAINVDDARIPDNDGQQPIDQPIVAEGPVAYFSRLPIKAIVAAVREAGIPASVSQTAGTFTCNHVMYRLLHWLETNQSQARGGFIHIPYLPEQAVSHPGAPSMSSASVIQALEIALQVTLSVDQDLRIAGGATH